MTADVIVVGGGLGGLAATVQLALDGARVSLVEQSGKLGGRAYSYIDAKTGDVVDNGQHVLVGAYHHTLRYLKNTGTRELLSIPEDFHLHFHHPTKGFETFSIAPALFPLSLAWATLRFRLVEFKERREFLSVGLRLRNWNDHLEQSLRPLTVAQWLRVMNQSDEAKRSFWYPLAISVMNELPEKASALLFARSLHNTFFGDVSDSKILIPTTGQSELYVDGAKRIFANHGINILLKSEVKTFAFQRGKVVGVVLKNGARIRARAVISAVPYFALNRMLPEKMLRGPFAGLGQFRSSPIVSVHLWFNRPIMDRDFVGLIDRRVQWVFNRRRIMRENGKPENYLSAVISGAHRYVDLPAKQLIKMTVDDIASAYPPARRAKLTQSIVIKEKRATFSATNDIESFRPSHRTSVENFYLAGDWTDTELPPTIEGAILSGFRCAEYVSKS